MSVEILGVTKLFGDQKALNDVTFKVNTGEIVGFLGPNGAGKSTMMKIITGFIPPTSGKVLINGIETGHDNTATKRKTGYLPENNPLYPEMYVREYLGYVASFYIKGKEKNRAVDNIIELTGLTPEVDKKIGALSKGYRQRVGLAQALVHNPEILILDEATSGLDPNQIVEIRELIKEAGKQKTVLLSTHIMQEAEAICNRIIIIDRGKIVADEEKEKIYSKILHPRNVYRAEFDKAVDEKLLAGIPGVLAVNSAGNNTWILESSRESDIRPAIFSFAVSNSIMVLSLAQQKNTLEEIFHRLTT